jgi:hypothetical protein
MARGESVRDHVLLRQALALTKLANTSAQGAKESGVIHAQFLVVHEQKHHEQNSCVTRHRIRVIALKTGGFRFSRSVAGYLRNLSFRIGSGATSKKLRREPPWHTET